MTFRISTRLRSLRWQYPRFEPLHDEFLGILRRFRAVVEDLGLGAIDERQVEVTYVNWVDQTSLSGFLRAVGDTVLPVPGIEARPVSESWRAKYSVRSGDRQVGWLRVEAAPSQRRSPGGVQPGYTLTLTYLGPTSSGPSTTVDAQIRRGRDLIVRTFAELTEVDMHAEETWGRTQ